MRKLLRNLGKAFGLLTRKESRSCPNNDGNSTSVRISEPSEFVRRNIRRPNNAREEVSSLIDSLPIIEEVSWFYDGPDLRSASSRNAWNDASDIIGSCDPAEFAYWHTDALIACGRLAEALKVAPRPGIQKWSLMASKLLSLKLELDQPPEAIDLIGLFGPRLTRFGRENFEQVLRFMEIKLNGYPSDASLIREWASDAHENEHGMSLFNGHASYIIVRPPRGLSFNHSPTAEAFCIGLIRDAENTWREEQGIPRIGEGWVAETALYCEIRDAFPQQRVEHHATPDWLGRQHLDIFLPGLSVAIEYQGIQHDMPVAFFGGEAAFEETKKRDARKRRLCTRNGVRLLYAREGYKLPDLVSQIHMAAIKEV